MESSCWHSQLPDAVCPAVSCFHNLQGVCWHLALAKFCARVCSGDCAPFFDRNSVWHENLGLEQLPTQKNGCCLSRYGVVQEYHAWIISYTRHTVLWSWSLHAPTYTCSGELLLQVFKGNHASTQRVLTAVSTVSTLQMFILGWVKHQVKFLDIGFTGSVDTHFEKHPKTRFNMMKEFRRETGCLCRGEVKAALSTQIVAHRTDWFGCVYIHL